MRPHGSIRFWQGETLGIMPDVMLICAGGHFPGGTVLHWAEGAGTLLAGDIPQVTPGAHRASFMWSYPNMMPLPASAIRQIEDRLRPWRYERIFGAFPGQDVLSSGPAIVAQSAQRYVALISS